MTEQRVPIEDLLAQREWIRRLARGLVQGAADRDDVEQETWVRALRTPPQPGGSLRGWLARVVRSVGIDRHRAERQRRLREQGVARREAVGAGDNVAEAEAFLRVVEAAYGLDEPHRTVVLLRYFEELTFAEIGRRLGIDEEAVRSRHRRALVRMRERLDERSGGDRGAWLGAVGAVASRRAGPWPATERIFAPREDPTVRHRSRSPAVPALISAGVAGGVVMGAAKVTAAVVVIVLAAGAWWALRDEGGSTPEPESAAAASSDVETATTPVRRARARTAAESRTKPSSDVAAPAAPAGPTETAGAAGTREVRLRVVDERGAPVAGATVRIVRANFAGLPRFGAEVTTVTDEAGDFTAVAPQGPLVARVSLEGYADAQSDLVEGESELRVRLVRAWTLRGTVVAKETGQGAAHVPVLAFRSGTSDIVVMTATDAEGKFAAAGLPEEAIDLRVADGQDYAPPLAGEAPTANAPPYAPGRLNALPPRSGEVRIELLPGRSIAGVLVDDAGSPVSSRVVVEVLGRTAQGGPDYSVRRSGEVRDAGGAFRIDGLAEGEYDLNFVPAAPASAAERTLGAVRVPAVGTGTADLRVVLSSGAPLRFRVVDPDGKPLDGGHLYVHPPEQLAGSHGTVMAAPRLDGRYETPPLDRAKSFDVLVTHFAGHFPTTRKGLRPGGDEVVVTLDRAGRVAGRVLDEEGRPVGAGVPVTANGQGVDRQLPGSGWVGYTDASGSFVVEALGDHAFTFAAGGAESGFYAAAPARDVRTGRTDLVLRVRRGVALSGRLVDAEGKPVRTHLLNASPIESEGGLSASTKIDGDDGRFVFRGVRPGRVRISCYLGDRFVDVGEVEAPRADVELVLPAR